MNLFCLSNKNSWNNYIETQMIYIMSSKHHALDALLNSATHLQEFKKSKSFTPW